MASHFIVASSLVPSRPTTETKKGGSGDADVGKILSTYVFLPLCDGEAFLWCICHVRRHVHFYDPHIQDAFGYSRPQLPDQKFYFLSWINRRLWCFVG